MRECVELCKEGRVNVHMIGMGYCEREGGVVGSRIEKWKRWNSVRAPVA